MWYDAPEPIPIFRQKDKIIGIPNVVRCFQFMFYPLIQACKKLLDVTLKHPTCPRMVPADLIRKFPKTIQCSMHALVIAAGKRISNKRSIKKRIRSPIYRMMQEPVAHIRFMDVP